MSQPIQIAIYVLCFLASVACAWLLLRGFLRSGTRLLLWSGVCFFFLSLNSLIVLLDMLIFPQLDFQVWRHAASLLAAGVLLFGLVWESE